MGGRLLSLFRPSINKQGLGAQGPACDSQFSDGRQNSEGEEPSGRPVALWSPEPEAPWRSGGGVPAAVPPAPPTPVPPSPSAGSAEPFRPRRSGGRAAVTRRRGGLRARQGCGRRHLKAGPQVWPRVPPPPPPPRGPTGAFASARRSRGRRGRGLGSSRGRAERVRAPGMALQVAHSWERRTDGAGRPRGRAGRAASVTTEDRAQKREAERRRRNGGGCCGSAAGAAAAGPCPERRPPAGRGAALTPSATGAPLP